MLIDIISVFVLTLLWLLVCLVGHGYSNTVDIVALWLHRHAMDCRKRHERRQAAVQEQWVRQLEVDGQ